MWRITQFKMWWECKNIRKKTGKYINTLIQGSPKRIGFSNQRRRHAPVSHRRKPINVFPVPFFMILIITFTTCYFVISYFYDINIVKNLFPLFKITRKEAKVNFRPMFKCIMYRDILKSSICFNKSFHGKFWNKFFKMYGGKSMKSCEKILAKLVLVKKWRGGRCWCWW